MPTPQPTETSHEDGIEWLQGRSDLAAISVTLLGFLARLWAAHATFLNPDEALHFRLANQLSLAQAYKESLTASHPPLLTFLLYYWRGFGTSEPWLRLPSVLAGTVFCWMLYKWLSNAAGRLAGFIALLLAAFLPPIVLLSAEIRQYALLLAFLASALYFLDEAFAEKSASGMVAFSLCLYLAMLSHYSAFLFASALGVYALLKIFTERLPGVVVATWAAGQVGALALAAFLYKTHLAKLGAGESRTVLQGWMSEFYLYRSYFDAGRDNPFLFVIGHSFGVFQFVFGQLAVADVAGLLFVVALFLLVRGTKIPGQHSLSASRQLALLLVLTFASVCGASLAHFYPYGGTRHSAMLVIPALAGISVAIARLIGQRGVRAVLITGFIVALCIAFGKQRQPYMQRSDQSLMHMNEAIDFLRQNATAPQIVFTDYESDLILGHYLCGQKPIMLENSVPDFEVFSCDGIRVVSASYSAATLFDANKFLALWARLTETYHLRPGETVWVFQAGWG
ncbi:MAG: glycosyltransferase family 39 protein, partial [Candidatus Sulfotelmatobacter sp.]